MAHKDCPVMPDLRRRKEMAYRKKGEIVTRSIAGETILVPIRAKLADMEQLIVLDGIGDFVWERLDGKTEVTAIVDAVANEYDVDKETARQDVREFLDALVKAGLIEEPV